MYSYRRVKGRTREKLECVRVSMCQCYVDMCERMWVVSECERERVNEVDLHIYIHIRARSTSMYTYGVCG